jgi:hypothetical protein
MIYSIPLLTTVADCDLVIQAAALQKTDLQFKRYSLEKKRSSSSTTTASIEAQIPGVEAEITAYETVLASLPAGDAKDEMQSRLTKSKYKLFILLEKRSSYGVIAVLDLELEMGFIDANIAEMDLQTAAVTAHKATL